MKEWLEVGIHQVNGLLDNDSDFQTLLKQLGAAQAEYQAIISTLTAEQRLAIENYIALSEEIEYQKTLTAYYCGKRNG